MNILIIVTIFLISWLLLGFLGVLLAAKCGLLWELDNKDVLLLLTFGLITLSTALLLIAVESIKHKDWKITKFLNNIIEK